VAGGGIGVCLMTMSCSRADPFYLHMATAFAPSPGNCGSVMVRVSSRELEQQMNRFRFDSVDPGAGRFASRYAACKRF
jgi:hypothetical protein